MESERLTLVYPIANDQTTIRSDSSDRADEPVAIANGALSLSNVAQADCEKLLHLCTGRWINCREDQPQRLLCRPPTYAVAYRTLH